MPDNNIETIRLLLDAGANPIDETDDSPLHNAMVSREKTIPALLLTKVSNISIQDADGNTPLHWAVEYQYEVI